MKAEMNGLNERVVERLTKLKMYISTAESCTGGMLSALITDVPGSSLVMSESIVTYSNEAKMTELGVSADTLLEKGAVARETAIQMAEGVCRRTGADVGVGITGIAGPGGGTETKPVGTVFAAISILGETSAFHLRIEGTRGEVREETCRFVLERLLELLPDADRKLNLQELTAVIREKTASKMKDVLKKVQIIEPAKKFFKKG